MIAVVNCQTLAVSEYALDVVDVVAYDDALVAMTESTLTEFGDDEVGDTPVGVLETGWLSFGIDGQKHVTTISPTLQTASTSTLQITAELDGRELELGPYDLPSRSGSAPFVRQFKVAGGIKADNISLTFESPDDTTWALRGVTLQAVSF